MIREMNDYIEALQALNMDEAGRQRAIDQVNASGITVNDGSVAFSYLPLLVTDEDLEIFHEVIGGVQQILSKMTQRYIDDPDYRQIFGFDSRMEELICLPCDYPCMIPFGRYDLFYDFETGRYGFCEINTDGSGGMSWNDRVTNAILEHFADQEYLQKRGIRLMDSTKAFAHGVIETYRTSAQSVADPLIAIVDFKEEGVLTDFDDIIDEMNRRGVRARFTDLRDLYFDGTVLRDRTDDQVIHGIYRRAVTSVVLERWEECQQLIEAVRHNKVVLMGHFRTSLAHSKTVFAAMYHPKTMAFLTKEEQMYVRAHIPETYILQDGLLGEGDICRVKAQKDQWVLKPEEGFASYGVTCGMDVDEEAWCREVDEALQKPYILQKFCERYTIPVLCKGRDQVDHYPLMLGIFQNNGRAVGCYSRAGAAGVVDYSHGCVCVGTARIE